MKTIREFPATDAELAAATILQAVDTEHLMDQLVARIKAACALGSFELHHPWNNLRSKHKGEQPGAYSLHHVSELEIKALVYALRLAGYVVERFTVGDTVRFIIKWGKV